MKRHFGQAAILLLLVGAIPAEPVYLRNRLFKGPQQGSGKNLLIGMQAFAEVMELKVSQQDGTYFLHPKTVTGTDFGVSDPGSVYVVGRKVVSQTLPDGTVLISLWQSAESAGFRVSPNSTLGTIDVTKAPVPKLELPMDVAAAPEAESASETAIPAEESSKSTRKSVKKGTVPGRGDQGLKAVTPLPPRYINRAGAAVDCAQAITPGRYNLVVFGADW